MLQVLKVKNKLFKHKKSGNVYTCLGVINHKDEITREWVEHIFYTGDGVGVYEQFLVEGVVFPAC